MIFLEQAGHLENRINIPGKAFEPRDFSLGFEEISPMEKLLIDGSKQFA
jgi:hypothetical protein